jgi:hypothetical protein
MRTKKEAEQEAKTALSLLKTSGWKVHVFENVGWHWKITNLDGFLSLHKQESGGYWCLLDDTIKGVGNLEWADNRQFKDPNLAASAVLGKARKSLNRLETLLHEARVRKLLRS